jgi:hypothetical protein
MTELDKLFAEPSLVRSGHGRENFNWAKMEAHKLWQRF